MNKTILSHKSKASDWIACNTKVVIKMPKKAMAMAMVNKRFNLQPTQRNIKPQFPHYHLDHALSLDN